MKVPSLPLMETPGTRRKSLALAYLPNSFVKARRMEDSLGLPLRCFSSAGSLKIPQTILSSLNDFLGCAFGQAFCFGKQRVFHPQHIAIIPHEHVV